MLRLSFVLGYVAAVLESLVQAGALAAAAPRDILRGHRIDRVCRRLATRLAPRYGLDRSIQGGLITAATGGVGMLLVALYHPTLLSYLAALSVFLLGMGIVSPLGTAQALSPFGDKAGGIRAGRLLVDDDGRHRRLARSHDLAGGAVRARDGADGVFAGGCGALHAAGQRAG
jgi:hypothetical protein